MTVPHESELFDSQQYGGYLRYDPDTHIASIVSDEATFVPQAYEVSYQFAVNSQSLIFPEGHSGSNSSERFLSFFSLSDLGLYG